MAGFPEPVYADISVMTTRRWVPTMKLCALIQASRSSHIPTGTLDDWARAAATDIRTGFGPLTETEAATATMVRHAQAIIGARRLAALFPDVAVVDVHEGRVRAFDDNMSPKSMDPVLEAMIVAHLLVPSRFRDPQGECLDLRALTADHDTDADEWLLSA